MRILFFAQVKDATECAEAQWDDARTMSCDELWHRLEQTWPKLASHRSVTRLARNGQFATQGTLFQPNDEVALIPPVSGG